MSQQSKPHFVCPFHGLVEAGEETTKEINKEEVQAYKCPKEDCTITRTLQEMEYPE